MHPVHTPKNGGQTVNVLGTPMLLRLLGRDTNGTLAVVESHDSQGGGPPPHIHHRGDETFRILEGEYEFIIAGKTVSARVPIRCSHRAVFLTPIVVWAKGENCSLF